MSVMVPINKAAKISEDIKRLSSPELAELCQLLTDDNMGGKLVAGLQAELQDREIREKTSSLGRASLEQGGGRGRNKYNAERDPFNE